MSSNDCPNCGANLNLGNRNIAFCEFCGSKINIKSEAKPRNSDVYNQVLYELKFENYRNLEHALFKALLEEPNNNDLLLINAVTMDITSIDRIDFSLVSDMVRELCRKPLLLVELSYDYSLDLNELRKYKYSQLKDVKFAKLHINEGTNAAIYLKLAKFILTDDMYEEKVNDMNQLNDKAFVQHIRNFKRWKAGYLKKIVWSIIWFVLSAFCLLLVLGGVSIAPAIVFFLIGGFVYMIRKY